MASEPDGRAGVTHETAASPQLTSTSASSAKNEIPMRDTKAMIQRSTRL